MKDQEKINRVLGEIKGEIRQKQWHIGVIGANQVIEIIDKYISGREGKE